MSAPAGALRIGIPLWVAVLGYLLWASVVWMVAILAAVSVVIVAAAYALGMAGEVAWLRWRRRRTDPK